MSAIVVALVVIVAIRSQLAIASGEAPNACGCYQDSTGSCLCGKKSKCGCPGACEPKGCEEKLEKTLKREIDAETRKAREADRRRQSSGGDEDQRESQAKDEESAAAKHRAAPSSHVRMTAAQRKTLAHLLDLYLAEHPDEEGNTLDHLHRAVAPPTGKR